MLVSSIAIALALVGGDWSPEPDSGSPATGYEAAVAPSREIASGGLSLEGRLPLQEVRGRVGGDIWVRPTMVTLDFRQETAAAILAKVRDRTGLAVDLLTPEAGTQATDLVDCQISGSLPFWAAIDAIGEAGGLRSVFDDATHPLAMLLIPGDPREAGPTSDHGPFRVILEAIRTRGERRLTRSGSSRVVTPAPRPLHLELDLRLAAEPRFRVIPAGPVRIIEATDEVGRRLQLQRDSGDDSPADLISWVGAERSGFPTQVVLRVESLPGLQIGRIRGVIPVGVTLRKLNPVTISLEGSGGQSVRVNDLNYILGEPVPATKTSPARVVCSIGSVLDQPAEHPRRVEPDPSHLEILDAAGHSLAWFPTVSTYEGTRTWVELTVVDREAQPKTLRFHALDRVVVEVPFTFESIPLP